LEKYSAEYWNRQYLESKTGWDIGYISTPIKEYIDQLTDKSIKILVPGAGNAYEVDIHKALAIHTFSIFRNIASKIFLTVALIFQRNKSLVKIFSIIMAVTT